MKFLTQANICMWHSVSILGTNFLMPNRNFLKPKIGTRHVYQIFLPFILQIFAFLAGYLGNEQRFTYLAKFLPNNFTAIVNNKRYQSLKTKSCGKR